MASKWTFLLHISLQLASILKHISSPYCVIFMNDFIIAPHSSRKDEQFSDMHRIMSYYIGKQNVLYYTTSMYVLTGKLMKKSLLSWQCYDCSLCIAFLVTIILKFQFKWILKILQKCYVHIIILHILILTQNNFKHKTGRLTFIHCYFKSPKIHLSSFLPYFSPVRRLNTYTLTIRQSFPSHTPS